MKLFAIADLHMDGGAGKPMDVFGPNWENHCERIFSAWRENVAAEDAVLVPGDISWAMHLKEALPDLTGLSFLPGAKVLLRGNHDYWWSSLTQMRSLLPKDIKLVQNDAADCGCFVAAGSRGWLLPTNDDFTASDRKIYERELIRLELSLSAAKRMAGNTRPIVAMMHFPPLMRDGEPTGFSALLEKYGVSHSLYGHLHGSAAWEAGFRGDKNGVRYTLVSADSIDFSPALIAEFHDTEEEEA